MRRKVFVTIRDLHTGQKRTTTHIVDLEELDWRTEALEKALSPQRPRCRQFEGEFKRELTLGDVDRWFGQICEWVPAANAWSCGNRVVVDFWIHHTIGLAAWMSARHGVEANEQALLRVASRCLNDRNKNFLADFANGASMADLAKTYGLHLASAYRLLDTIGERIRVTFYDEETTI